MDRRNRRLIAVSAVMTDSKPYQSPRRAQDIAALEHVVLVADDLVDGSGCRCRNVDANLSICISQSVSPSSTRLLACEPVRDDAFVLIYLLWPNVGRIDLEVSAPRHGREWIDRIASLIPPT